MAAAIADPAPDVALALATVPPPARAAFRALWAVDDRLAGIAIGGREPALAMIRLAWWRDALEALATAPPPAEPLLEACAAAGLDGPALAATASGWEAILEDPDVGDEAVARHAEARGGGVFMLAGALLGAGPDEAVPLREGGVGWARVDLARHVQHGMGRPARAAAIRASARGPLERAMAPRWPRRLRPLGQLAALALADSGPAPLAGRGRALRVLRHQWTGR